MDQSRAATWRKVRVTVMNRIHPSEPTRAEFIKGVFAKTNPQLDFNPKPIPKLESNAKLT